MATAVEPQTLYHQLMCDRCDARLGGRHLPFCRSDGTGIYWQELREFVLRRDGWSCRYCGWSPVAETDLRLLHVDHVRPKSQGGLDVPWNLVTACRTCNCSKGAHIPEWLLNWERSRADYEAGVEDAYLASLGVYD